MKSAGKIPVIFRPYGGLFIQLANPLSIIALDITITGPGNISVPTH